jgi:hypothetical protein
MFISCYNGVLDFYAEACIYLCHLIMDVLDFYAEACICLCHIIMDVLDFYAGECLCHHIMGVLDFYCWRMFMSSYNGCARLLPQIRSFIMYRTDPLSAIDHNTKAGKIGCCFFRFYGVESQFQYFSCIVSVSFLVEETVGPGENHRTVSSY